MWTYLAIVKIGADFAFGYFDGSGVHWMLPDAIGSIELVVSGAGHVEQHTGYYPYGQPWRAVAGQQRLFGGKELRTFAGLNDYDFHARRQNPAEPFFESADRHAANDPARSPWTFAAANPVRFTDPSGLDIYTLDGNGHVISCFKNDTIDQVVLLDQGMRRESNTYKKGTIQNFTSMPGLDGGTYDYFKIKGDDAALDIYTFLADNTSVEFSLWQCGVSGENSPNYISTAHSVDSDVAGAYLYGYQLLFGYYIRRHIHSHPSGLVSASAADVGVYKYLKNFYKYSNEIELWIYGGNGQFGFHTLQNLPEQPKSTQPVFKIDFKGIFNLWSKYY